MCVWWWWWWRVCVRGDANLEWAPHLMLRGVAAREAHDGKPPHAPTTMLASPSDSTCPPGGPREHTQPRAHNHARTHARTRAHRYCAGPISTVSARRKVFDHENPFFWGQLDPGLPGGAALRADGARADLTSF